MPRLSRRSIGAPTFAAILLLGTIAATLSNSEIVAGREIQPLSDGATAFDEQMTVLVARIVPEAQPQRGDGGLSSSESGAASERMSTPKTTFSNPRSSLQIAEPRLLLATAGKSSDRVTLSLTNSVDKIYAYSSSLDNLAAGFTVIVCSDGFVRPNSHCTLTIVYRPKAAGSSAANLSLRFIEVGGTETETLVVPLSGYAMGGGQ